MRGRRTAVALVAVALVAGCTHGKTTGASTVSISVMDHTAIDEPLNITVSGVSAGKLVTLELTSTDSRSIPWKAAATFRSPTSGPLDTRLVAPESGDYTGVDGMGLVEAMAPTRHTDALGYFWDHEMAFRLRAIVGKTELASVTFGRRLEAHPVHRLITSLAKQGFVGEYWSPTAPAAKRTAVLMLGGSEGGASQLLESALLAGHGVSALNLAYFRMPGLPERLEHIPLEYFAKALTWLAHQPGVDPSHLYVEGVSRGSEAALLLGAHYPSLVRGVIALVPENNAIGCHPQLCAGGAWTFGDKEVPYTRQFDVTYPTDVPNAAIEVEKIEGPVLLNCGGQDFTWNSCDFADAIVARLKAKHFTHSVTLRTFPDSGHGVGEMTPYEPCALPDPPADQRARAAFWPDVLAFLKAT